MIVCIIAIVIAAIIDNNNKNILELKRMINEMEAK
tara:strand:+ start:1809 stop:1913 length:105 start_codon:yes stop_codon:yes gene_type:complete